MQDDFAEHVFFAAISGFGWWITTNTPVSRLSFPKNDPGMQYPFHKTTIPMIWVSSFVFLLATLLPLISYFLSGKYPTIFKKCHLIRSISVNVFAICLTGIATNIFKSYVGRPRPHFYQRCNIDPMNDTECNLPKADLEDIYKSWPSGHSSIAMSGSLFSCLFLLKAFRIRRAPYLFAALLLMFFPMYIGSTRIKDFKHRPDDVIAGFLLGFIISFTVFEQQKENLFFNGQTVSIL